MIIRLLSACVLMILCASASAQETSGIYFRVSEKDEMHHLPCRVHLKDSKGQPVQPPDVPFWKNHFSCNGDTVIKVPPGDYEYEVTRGPEYRPQKGKVQVSGDVPVRVNVQLERTVNLSSEGWWSGETHVHRPIEDAELLMRSEDLHVAHFITWWNAKNPWTRLEQKISRAPLNFDETYFYDQMGGEDEREGGALLFLNFFNTLNIAAAKKHHPSSIVFARAAHETKSDVWIDAEKPFWWDLPMWVAEGAIDTIGIANNHMDQFGMLDNEAWGKPRNLQRFPAPHGNGFWTQEIYYHLLNCGLRIPPSAGSASGVLPNPVGYNRIYAHIDGAVSYEKWVAAVKAGQTFVTNGPLLPCTVDGKLPGYVFRADPKKKAPLVVKLSGNDKVLAIEIVQNGKVIHSIKNDGGVLTADVPLEPGWFLIRCIAEVPETFRFASTAPFYVETAAQGPRISKISAQFFVDWCKERVPRFDWNKEFTELEKGEVRAVWKNAEAFWLGKVKSANTE